MFLKLANCALTFAKRSRTLCAAGDGPPRVDTVVERSGVVEEMSMLPLRLTCTCTGPAVVVLPLLLMLLLLLLLLLLLVVALFPTLVPKVVPNVELLNGVARMGPLRKAEPALKLTLPVRLK